MASLVHLISTLTNARYGVNILELRPPGEVQGASTNVVGSVADLPWGPVDVVTLITSPAEFFDTFSPGAFGALEATFPALLAYINKTFPASMKVVRIAATGQASSVLTFDDGAVDSIDATARHPGLIGDQILVGWVDNADTPGNRDMRVVVGSYDVTYPNVVVATGLVTTDPGDPFVGVVANGSQVAVPAIAVPTALAGGSDGTAVVGDFLGAAPGGRGLEEYADVNVDVDVIFGAEIPQALVAAWNAGLKTFQDTHKRGVAVLSTDALIVTPATAITDVAAFRSDRLVQTWPRVKTVNTYDPNRAEIAVDGNAFAAVAIASVAPEVSPGGAPGAPFLKGITGLAITGALTADAYKSLNDAGIAPWFNSTDLEGFIIHRGFTTSLVSGKERIFRRRMTDFLLLSMAGSAAQFTGDLLDLDLPNKALGANTSIQMGMWTLFLTDLRDSKPSRIRGFELDAFGANLQSNIDAGQWKVAVAVKLISAQEELVFLAEVGERVILTAA